MSHRARAAALVGMTAVVAALALAGCASGGGATPTAPAAPAGPPPSTQSAPQPAGQPPAAETNPAGDIPDNQAFVPFAAPDATFSVSVPEGWARTNQGQATIFTDKLNSVRIDSQPRPTAPDAASVTASEVPALRSSVSGFQGGQVSMVQRKAGTAVLVSYQAVAPPDPVTGRSITDAVQRYEFWKSGQQVTLTLSGPTGADNVDPWRLVTDSLRWLR
jgi:hypothetical protein